SIPKLAGTCHAEACGGTVVERFVADGYHATQAKGNRCPDAGIGGKKRGITRCLGNERYSQRAAQLGDYQQRSAKRDQRILTRGLFGAPSGPLSQSCADD